MWSAKTLEEHRRIPRRCQCAGWTTWQFTPSSRGHEGIVKLLVENGADINAQGGEYGSALQGASSGGHEAIVKLLVEMGVRRKESTAMHSRGRLLEGTK
jgi:Ankyrin repeats (many copies)